MNPSNVNSYDVNFMEATYTLTNAVPQFIKSNRGLWRIFEGRIVNYAATTCAGKPNGSRFSQRFPQEQIKATSTCIKLTVYLDSSTRFLLL